jgi:hypothetical protein
LSAEEAAWDSGRAPRSDEETGNDVSRKKLAAAYRRMIRGAGATRSYRTNGRTETTENSGQDQCCKRNLKRADVREEMLGATETQQWNTETRPKGAITTGSTGNVDETFRQTLGLDIAKRIAGAYIRLREMSVSTLWRGRPPPKRRRVY